MDAEVAAYIGRWRPVSVSPDAAALARLVTQRAAPSGRKRANALLHAAARLAEFAVSLGLELAPEVVFHPSVIERFARAAPGLSDPARRTLRTNQRFIARRVVPQLHLWVPKTMPPGQICGETPPPGRLRQVADAPVCT